ncbi:hypothetical protein LTR53_008456 [Teratosphaeriaceae sp. CCFEE 6253]|nr:hypothetical protein LTR53_008456 [Teratosphaeriaceae sp. CCFEE 6253]
MSPGSSGSHTEVDLLGHPTAQQLVGRCRDSFAEVEDLTPGHELEAYLNTNYGPGNAVYEDLCNLARQGLEEGWVANVELDGAKYRRSKILQPSAENRFFSITTVYIESEDESTSLREPSSLQYDPVMLIPYSSRSGRIGWRKR